MKKIMWEKCGIVRSVAGLNAGLAELREFNREAETAMKKTGQKTAALLAFRNAVESSILVVKSALARKESRGLQSILDYPETSAKIVHHSFYFTQPFAQHSSGVHLYENPTEAPPDFSFEIFQF